MCYYLAAQTWTHGSYCYESALLGVATADLLLHGTNSFAEVSCAGLVGASGASRYRPTERPSNLR